MKKPLKGSFQLFCPSCGAFLLCYEYGTVLKDVTVPTWKTSMEKQWNVSIYVMEKYSLKERL